MLIIIPARKVFNLIPPLISRILKKPLIFLKFDTEASETVHFTIELPFTYIDIDSNPKKCRGIMYSEMIGVNLAWIIKTTGVEFSDILSMKNVTYTSKGGVTSVENIYRKENVEKFYEIIHDFLVSNIQINNIRFIEGYSVLYFPCASDIVYHFRPISFAVDLVNSFQYLNSFNEENDIYDFLLEHRGISRTLLQDMGRIFLSDKIYSKRGRYTRKFLEKRIKPLIIDRTKNSYIYSLYARWIGEKKDINLFSKNKGIMVGNKNFSTAGILQEYYHFLLTNLEWDSIIKEAKRFF